MNLRAFVATMCGAGVACVQLAIAQNAQEVRQPVAQPRQVQGQVQVQQQPGAANGQRPAWHDADHALASCVAIGNQEEIAISKFAEKKAKNSDVKEFCQMAEKDHQSFLKKLERFAPEATRQGFLMEDRRQAQSERAGVQRAGGTAEEPARIQQTAQQQPAAQPGAQPARVQPGTQQPGQVQQFGQPAPQGHIDMLQIHKELAEQCLTDTKEELGKKDSKEFDECFMGLQLAKHHEMKDKLIVFQRHTSPELKQLLAEGQQTTEKHLKKAEEIMKSLKDSSDKSSSKK